MVIQHNIAALNSHRNLGINNAATNKNLEKLSSGFRINRAGDDAAGLAISEKMRGQIRGLAMAEQNTNNGISLIQTAEGGLNETHAILQRMRELAVQASNGTYQDEDRAQIQLEVRALIEEVDRISTSTHYNGINLLDGNLDVNGFSTKATTVQASDLSITAAAITAATGASPAFTAIGIDDTFEVKAQNVNGTMKYTGKANIGGAEYTMTTADNGVTWEIQNTAGGGGGATNAKIAFTGAASTAGGFEISGKFGAASGAVALNTLTYGEYRSGADLIFQIGANGTADQQVGLSVRSMGADYIGQVDPATGNLVANRSIADVDLRTRASANIAIDIIDGATNMVSSQRAELGALQNRLEHTLNNLGVTKENLTAAESTIRDVDMAKEMMEFTKNSILVQASQAMLAQANSLPQGVLSLLR